jgi:acyl carrier protein
VKIQVAERVKDVLGQTFGLPEAKLVSEARLKDDLGLDSIDLFDLVGILEKDYGIHIEVGDFKDVETFGALVQRLEGLLHDSDTH